MGSVILIGVLADQQFAEYRKRRAAAKPVHEPDTVRPAARQTP
jgi:hypothetical protein